MQTDPFKEYLKQQEPDKKYKGYAWQTAIGLQAVDGLKPSEYLVDAAIQNIEGKITLDEVKNLLDSYYEEKPQKYLEKEIQERQPYFLSSIFEHLDLMQRMIYLRKMHGISEMHWFGQIIMI